MASLSTFRALFFAVADSASANSRPFVVPALRKRVHSSVYDKNEEEGVRPHLVPDHLIGSASHCNNTWVPHPTTGVFVPQSEHARSVNVCAQDDQRKAPLSVTDTDEQVWFRPLEDLQRPPSDS